MKNILMVLVILSLTGCAVKKMYGARGGSKSDGIVKMSYSYGSMQIPEVDESQGLSSAIRRCMIWGYKGAESFDFITRECQSTDGYGGCTVWLVTKEYQCL